MKWKLFVIFTLPVVCLLGRTVFVEAQVMQSNSYQIQSDSINVGGGRSTSTSFIQESTVGEVATGRATSTSFSLFAGYQQMQAVYLALSAAADVTLTPELVGLGGGESTGSTTVTVITDSPSGYQLTIAASQAPAMQSPSATIANYQTASSVPDLHFVTAAADVHFAFSPFGVDTAQRFLTNGSVCNVAGVASATACWEGVSTTPRVVARDSTPNHPDGATTTLYFRVGLGAASVVVPGTYTATTTVTLLPL